MDQFANMVVECVTEQLLAYRSILQIAKEQATLCEGADFSESEKLAALNSAIENRQKLIEYVESKKKQIDLGVLEHRKITGYTGSTDALLESIQCGKLWREIGQTIEATLELDKKASHAFEGRITSLRKDMKRVHDGKQTNKAYSGSGNAGQGFFIDKKQ